MAAATEDRLDVANKMLRHSLQHDFPMNDTTDEFFANTLAQVNSAGELLPVDHTDGEDDSALEVLALMERQDDEPFTGKLKRDRGGQDPLVGAVSGALIQFETKETIDNFAFGDTVYAVDNQTVAAGQADGGGGSYAEAGTVFEVLESEVKVYVPGILDN